MFLSNFTWWLTVVALCVGFDLVFSFQSTPSIIEPYFGRFAGSFQDFGPNFITGDVYFVNRQAMFLYNFSYDGQGAGNIY